MGDAGKVVKIEQLEDLPNGVTGFSGGVRGSG